MPLFMTRWPYCALYSLVSRFLVVTIILLGGGDRLAAQAITPTLLYSSYLAGSNSYVSAAGVAVDSSRNSYVLGTTYGAADGSFPCTVVGPSHAGNEDVFVMKIGADGSTLYSSCVGGSDSEYAFGIAVDAAGNAYVTGSTSSNDFPVVNG